MWLEPLLSDAMGSILPHPGREAPFLMTDTSVGLLCTVTCHSATLASEKPGGTVSLVRGRLKPAFRKKAEAGFGFPHAGTERFEQ